VTRIAPLAVILMLPLALCSCTTLPCAANAKPVRLYVAADGEDRNAGTRQHPLASLEAARDKLRALRATADPGARFEVVMRGGRYVRERSFALTKEDSGTESDPVVYRAYRRERVTLSGGRELDPRWCEPVAAGRIRDRLDPAVRDRVVQIDLRTHGIENYGEMAIAGSMLEVFCAGKRLPAARWPNEGWMKIGGVAKADDSGVVQFVDENTQGTCFQYDGTRPERWLSAPEALLHGFWFFGWMDDFVPIAAVDTAARTITLPRIPPGGIKKEQWFHALYLP